jgi:hypothetical protein
VKRSRFELVVAFSLAAMTFGGCGGGEPASEPEPSNAQSSRNSSVVQMKYRPHATTPAIAPLLDDLSPTSITSAWLGASPNASDAQPRPPRWLHVEIRAGNALEYTRGQWHAFLLAGALRKILGVSTPRTPGGVVVYKVVAGRKQFDYSGRLPRRLVTVRSAPAEELESSMKREARSLRLRLSEMRLVTLGDARAIEAAVSLPEHPTSVEAVDDVAWNLISRVVGAPWSARAIGIWLEVRDPRGHKLVAYGNAVRTTTTVRTQSASSLPSD